MLATTTPCDHNKPENPTIRSRSRQQGFFTLWHSPMPASDLNRWACQPKAIANPNLELFNLFPITVHPHWTIAMRLAQQRSQGPPPATRIFCSPEALIEELIRTGGTGETHNAVEKILKASTEYRNLQKSMPLLGNVPQIHAYRTKGDHMDHAALAAVNQEVLRTGGYLQEDQILYSGGNF